MLYRRELGREDDALAGQAARRLGAAGRGALGRGDNSAAVRLLERATTLPSQASPGRLEFVMDLVLALMEGARFDDCRVWIDELATAEDERLSTYATVLDPMVAHMSGRGSLESGRDALARSVETFGRLEDERGLALARTVQGHAEWTACRAAAGAERYRAAITHAERAGLASLVNEALGNLCAIALFGPTPVDAAEAEIRALMKGTSGVGAQATALRALGRLAAIRGDVDEGRKLVEQGRATTLRRRLRLALRRERDGDGVRRRAGRRRRACRKHPARRTRAADRARGARVRVDRRRGPRQQPSSGSVATTRPRRRC